MLNGRRADVRLPFGVAISVEAFNKLISIVFYGNYNYGIVEILPMCLNIEK